MPLSSAYGIGSNVAVKGKTTLVSRLAMAPGVAANSRALTVENIPHFTLWLKQTTNTGVGLGVTVELQGMVPINNASTPKWDTFDTYVMLPGGSPQQPYSPGTFTFPFSQVRLRMTASGAAVGDSLVEFILGATD